MAENSTSSTQIVQDLINLDSSLTSLLRQLDFITHPPKDIPRESLEQLCGVIANNLHANQDTRSIDFKLRDLSKPKVAKSIFNQVEAINQKNIQESEALAPEPSQNKRADLPTTTVPTIAVDSAQKPKPIAKEYQVEKYLKAQREYVSQLTAIRQLQLSLETPIKAGLIQKLEGQNIPRSQAQRIVDSQMPEINNIVWSSLISGHANTDVLTEHLIGSFNLAGATAVRYGLGNSSLAPETQAAIKEAVSAHPKATQAVLLAGDSTNLSRSQEAIISSPPTKQAIQQLAEDLRSGNASKEVIAEQTQNLKAVFTPLPIKLALSELESILLTNPQSPRIKTILSDLSHYVGPTNPAVSQLVNAARSSKLTPTIISSASALLGNSSLNAVLDEVSRAHSSDQPLSRQHYSALGNFQNLRPPDALEELAVWGLAKQGIAPSVARSQAQQLGPILQALALSQNVSINSENAKSIYDQVIALSPNHGALVSLNKDPDFLAAFSAAAAYNSSHPEIALYKAGIDRLNPADTKRLGEFLASQGVSATTSDPDKVARLTLQFFHSLGNSPAEQGKIDAEAYKNTFAALKTRETFATAFSASLSPEAMKKWDQLRESRDKAYAKWQTVKRPYSWVLDKNDRYHRFVNTLPFRVKDGVLARMGIPEDARKQLYRRNYLEFIEKTTGKTLLPQNGRWSFLRSPKASFSKWLGGKTKWFVEPITNGWTWVKALPGRGLNAIISPIKNLINRIVTKLWTVIKPIIEKTVQFVSGLIKKAVAWVVEKAALLAAKAISAIATLIGPEILIGVGITLLIVLIIILISSWWSARKTDKLASAQITPIGQTQDGGVIQDNPFADLVKTANPTVLADPVGDITYTYTIIPKQGNLTNVTIVSDLLNIYKQTGSTQVTLFPPNPPTTISSTFTSVPFVFSLNPSMDDSSITNTITISFTAPDGSQNTLTALATTLIGAPPTGCFVFQPPPAPDNRITAGPWPPTVLAQENAAASQIMSVFTNPNATLCSSPINVYFAIAGTSVKCGGWYLGGGTIAIDSRQTNCTATNALYTLSHEAGHVYDDRSGGISGTSFRAQGLVSWNGSTCVGNLYPFPITNDAMCYSENFAEGFARCITGYTVPANWCSWYRSNVYNN